MMQYRIAGNFQGIQFSQFSQLISDPQKLNPRNKKQPVHAQLAGGVTIVVGIPAVLPTVNLQHEKDLQDRPKASAAGKIIKHIDDIKHTAITPDLTTATANGSWWLYICKITTLLQLQ